MFARIRRSMEDKDQGFTLIELLVVIIILGILIAIAVPSYLSFKDRANNNAAQANIRAITPSIESWYSDNGTYVGMTLALLKSTYDQAIVVGNYSLGSVAPTATSYCIQSTSNGKTWSKTGPAGVLANAACP